LDYRATLIVSLRGLGQGGRAADAQQDAPHQAPEAGEPARKNAPFARPAQSF
jgi:hypothetical protein